MKTTLKVLALGLVLAIVAVVGTFVPTAFCLGEPPGTRADEIQFREGLAIAPVGRYGRSAVHEDAVEAQVVAAKWSQPKAGETVILPDGSARLWEPIKAGDDGWFRGRSLGGGYVHFAVPIESEQVMLLDAAGHNMVYVNGEPRTGDPYSSGWVRVPVRLRAGTNDFLFHVARGQLRAKLVPPKAAAQFDLADTTLPDLTVGEAVDCEAGVTVLNTSVEKSDSLAIAVEHQDGDAGGTQLPPVMPLGVRKVGVRLSGPAPDVEGERTIELRLLARDESRWVTLDTATIKLRVVPPTATHKRTFRSAIDGSVQYFAVVPEKSGERRAEGGGPENERPGLILTLHGAGVEAIGQAACYSSKPGVITVAATNRRPFGFDWEDWGRLDAIEVLEHSQRVFDTDPRRSYLTGHSMGGHGAWHVGVTFPDRFAAIGPSAGWVSMFSYAGARRGQPEGSEGPSARVADLLNRCMTPSDTLALSRNYQHHGVYVLHGEKDDNVPVAQARTMRQQLAGFHSDFAYHEEPGQGHWWGKDLAAFSRNGAAWGTACVDWPPMFDFFASRRIPEIGEVRHVEFVTASPGVSARSHWATIEAQTQQLKPSSVSIDHDATTRKFSGKTENVARLALDVGHLAPHEPIQAELDGQEFSDIPWPKPNEKNAECRSSNVEGSSNDETRNVPAPLASGSSFEHPSFFRHSSFDIRHSHARLWFERESNKWTVIAPPSPSLKGPHRSGPFKDAFRNHVVFVYATHGTPDENTWSRAKARYDAETFWYRGNGSIDVIADSDFDAAKDPDRNVILYGNAESNAAWQPLLAESPVQVRRSRIQIGDRVELGDDLGCLFVRPRPGSDTATVGVVSGAGVVGMRLADRLPYFVSGVAYPDCFVFDSEILTKGVAGVRVAGFFGNDWSVDSGEFVWRD